VHGTTNPPERPVWHPTAFTQLVNQQSEDVQIPHIAKTPRQLPKATAELSNNGLFDLEDRKELAQAPRRDPDTMHRTNLAGLDAV